MKVKAEDISYALNFLDDELIAECDKAREEVRVTDIPKKKARITSIMPFIAAAAALLIIGGVLIAVLPKLGRSKISMREAASNDAAVQAEEPQEMYDSLVTEAAAAEVRDGDVQDGVSGALGIENADEADEGQDGEGVSFYGIDGSYSLVGGDESVSEVHISCSALDDEIYDLITGLGGREDIEEEFGNTLLSFYVEDVPYGEAVKYDLCEDSDGSSYVFVFEDDDGKRIVPANEDEYELLRQLIDEQAANSLLYIYMSEN